MNDARRTVLVVDDDPDLLDIVSTLLDLHGVTAVTARDGIEALEVMHTRADLGLVLLDLMMPRMNGVDVLAEMKRDAALKTLPVVVISGNYETERAVFGMGADDYLVKPIDVPVLMGIVSRFIPTPGLSPETCDELTTTDRRAR